MDQFEFDKLKNSLKSFLKKVTASFSLVRYFTPKMYTTAYFISVYLGIITNLN